MSTRKRGELPAASKPRKLWGAPATTIDKEPAVRTEAEYLEYGQRCYAAGVADQPTAAERAERQRRSDDAIQAEETAWANYRNGRGPRPGRR